MLNSRGFTVLELLVAIAIIAILATFTLFTINDLRNKAANTASNVMAVEYIKSLRVNQVSAGHFPVPTNPSAPPGGLGSTYYVACLDTTDDECRGLSIPDYNSSLQQNLHASFSETVPSMPDIHSTYIHNLYSTYSVNFDGYYPAIYEVACSGGITDFSNCTKRVSWVLSENAPCPAGATRNEAFTGRRDNLIPIVQCTLFLE